MNSDINNVGEVKPEDYKHHSQMIDDDPDNINYKKNNVNPFELAEEAKNNNSLIISDSKSSSNIRKSDLSSFGRLSIRMKERISRYGDEDILIDFSSRHTAYLFSVWFVFVAVFICGFIVHFETDNSVTASSILWTFSGVLLFFAVIYSYLYYKCAKAKSKEELYKYLRFIPC
mgnify:CR=1 FL=1